MRQKANWETEFQKWLGADSGRDLPAIRFYSWDSSKNKVKTIKEWYKNGGIVCVSTDKYASVCKPFVDGDYKPRKRRSDNKKQNASVEEEPNPAKAAKKAEEDALLRKVRIVDPSLCILPT